MCITNNMVKSASSSTASSAAAPAAAAPAAAAPAPAAAKAAKAPSTPKAKAAEAAPVAAPAPVVEGAEGSAPVAVEVDGAVSTALYSSVLTKLQSAQAVLASIRSEVNELKRQHARELRAANKANKRRKTNANRAPSGFVKPTLISNELAAFLGKPEGSVLARTEVTREVNAYIRNQKLQDKDNGRKINPDAKLLKLLKLKKGEELTYFNLQKYMAAHFAKSSAAPAASAAAAGGAVKA
jgi:2-oxoglutarate dehydrogenase E2 component (dihydrolipoamide succinyltransferase)